MEPQILEGTLAELQQQFSSLPFAPEARLRLLVTEPETSLSPEEALLKLAQRENGLIMLPTPRLATLEAVQEALYQADREDARCQGEENVCEFNFLTSTSSSQSR